MGRFAHLHLHSEYSLLDGACRIGDIPKMAKAQGHDAVAITDHGVLYGAVDFYRACKDEGIKPIIGCEVYVAPRGRMSKDGRVDMSGQHLVLLVENETGYRNLIRLVSRSFTEGFYMRPRVDMELLREYHEGLIALSGCLAGAVPQLVLTGDYEGAKRMALAYRDIFGVGNFYLEIQDHNISDEKRIAASLLSISRETGIPLVATNDVHYLRAADAEMQSVLVCIQTNTTLAEGNPLAFETNEFYFKSTEQMERLFSMCPDAVENTALIADRCQFDFCFGELYLPNYPLDGALSHKKLLADYAYRGFEDRLSRGDIVFDTHSREEYMERLAYELSVIDQMGFNAYYLIVRDFVMYSKTHGIAVGPGRGSGAGSLVAYCVGITDVDSIRYDLLFERFLNPERQTMPDFDIDFCYENRDRAIAYVKERYGEDHVAQIITFGTLAARAAVRDVGRVLGMGYQDVDTVAKLISNTQTLKEALSGRELTRMYEDSEDIHRLIDIAMSIEGMPRHASTHAAGLVITEKPVSYYVPLAVNGDVVVTEFDMDTVAKLGLVKFDFLGLRYLTIMEKAVEGIRETKPDFDLTSVPLDDAATYRMIAAGETDGVFQLESNGIRRVLRDMRPNCFEDIIATIALYRPGPMDSIDTFIARKHGREPIAYSTPQLADILNNTYGCIVYQEQVMQIFRSLAGYSFARADLVRRAMSKKKAEVMVAERSDFLAGCASNGISADISAAIFADMESFASYAFNKSHATAYAMISYRTAYLKAHYPAEYLAALMSCGANCDPARFGVKVLPPDINESLLGFRATGGHVRYGFLAIKNVGRIFVDAVISERAQGAFRSFEDFIDRMASRDLNRRQVEFMIKCGCFDSFGIYRSRLLAVYDNLITRAMARVHSNATGQMDFFTAMDDTETVTNVEYPQIPELPLNEILAFEKEITGIYFSGHLFDRYTRHATAVKHIEIGEVIDSFDENSEHYGAHSDHEKVSLAGVVAAVTKKTTRKGDNMAFAMLEDAGGTIEIIFFPKQYEANGRYLSIGRGICVEGELNVREGEAPKLVVNRMMPLMTNEEYEANPPAAVARKLYLRVPNMEAPVTKAILQILTYVKGKSEVVFYNCATGKYLRAAGYDADVTEKLLRDLSGMLGDGNVIFK